MPSFEQVVSILSYLNSSDKILAFGGILLAFIGIIANIQIKSTSVSLDLPQRVLAIFVGMSAIALSVLPGLITFSKNRVSLEDLLQLRHNIDTTQQIIIRGLTAGNGSEGDKNFHARKELPYASDWNNKSQNKINEIITKVQSSSI